MGDLHPDPEVHKAIKALMEALAAWESLTGRGTTLVVVPHDKEAPLVVSIDGLSKAGVSAIAAVKAACQLRGR